MLSPAELSRYARQLVLPELGEDGQERLRQARVLVVGAGGLGSPAALYLAAAGVGTLGLIDNDSVELSNLHRQVLHGGNDVGTNKAASGAAALRRLNDAIVVNAIPVRLTAERAKTMFPDYHLIVDGTDNFQTRYVINDACAELGKVWVYGSVERFSGQVSVFGAPDGPCYRCLFPEPPAPGTSASCEEMGVLGAIPGVVGSLQAVEALKWLAGIGEPLVGRLFQIDFLRTASQVIAFERRSDCRSCGKTGVTYDVQPSLSANDDADVEPRELADQLRAGIRARLLDVREPWEWTIGRIGDAMAIAINDLPSQIGSLDASETIIVYCHHGVRSAMAADWLRTQGYRARNLSGGIDRWSRDVDASVPRY